MLLVSHPFQLLWALTTTEMICPAFPFPQQLLSNARRPAI